MNKPNDSFIDMTKRKLINVIKPQCQATRIPNPRNFVMRVKLRGFAKIRIEGVEWKVDKFKWRWWLKIASLKHLKVKLGVRFLSLRNSKVCSSNFFRIVFELWPLPNNWQTDQILNHHHQLCPRISIHVFMYATLVLWLSADKFRVYLQTFFSSLVTEFFTVAIDILF